MDELLIREQELRKNIADLLNSCGLPAFVVESVLKDVLQEVTLIKKQQYEEALKNVEKKKKEKNNG